LIDFFDTIEKGKPGEIIFREDFLDFLNIKYIDVTDCQQFQIIDTDYICKIGTYEIKLNYKDNNIIIIEEYTNYNSELGSKSPGWYYKSKADILVFISKDTRKMVLIPFTEKFKKHYEEIKENYKLILNQISFNRNTKSRWQSAFRKIPLEAISGYYSKWQRQ